MILNDGNIPNCDFVEILCKGMRQTTSNMIKRSYSY